MSHSGRSGRGAPIDKQRFDDVLQKLNSINAIFTSILKDARPPYEQSTNTAIQSQTEQLNKIKQELEEKPFNNKYFIELVDIHIKTCEAAIQQINYVKQAKEGGSVVNQQPKMQKTRGGVINQALPLPEKKELDLGLTLEQKRNYFPIINALTEARNYFDNVVAKTNPPYTKAVIDKIDEHINNVETIKSEAVKFNDKCNAIVQEAIDYCDLAIKAYKERVASSSAEPMRQNQQPGAQVTQQSQIKSKENLVPPEVLGFIRNIQSITDRANEIKKFDSSNIGKFDEFEDRLSEYKKNYTNIIMNNNQYAKSAPYVDLALNECESAINTAKTRHQKQNKSSGIKISESFDFLGRSKNKSPENKVKSEKQKAPDNKMGKGKK